MDLVSIVIPSYNPSGYLLAAIESARSQTHLSIEIILVEDGSDHAASHRIIEESALKVDLFLQQPNRGLPAARNAGFRAARGSYIVPLDQDDLLRPQYVEACLGVLHAEPEAAFSYTDYSVFGKQNYAERCGEYNLYRLLDRNFLTYAALIRKGAWEQAGGYDESMRFGYEDWELWLRLGAKGRFGAHIPRRLFRYRKHGYSLYDVALSRHSELVAYIQSKHPDLYEYNARASVKSRWSPAVCIVDPPMPIGQTIQDVEIASTADLASPDRRSPAPAFLFCHQGGGIGPHSAEMAALAVWGGYTELQLPDGSVAMSRAAAEKRKACGQSGITRPGRAKRNVFALAPRTLLHRHLVNAGLLSWRAWLEHPVRSILRLIPLRVKERINRLTGRGVFDLAFYLQFQPNSLMFAAGPVEALRYFPLPSTGRPRVALITPHLGVGGAEDVLLQVASTLSRDRFEVFVLATHSRDARWSGRWQRCVEHVYDLGTCVPPERMSAAVLSIVSNWRCDFVLVQNTLSGYAALPHIKRGLPEIKTIDLVHAIDDRWDQIAVTGSVASFLDLRIAVSDAVRERLLASGTPRERVRMVRAGINLERFPAAPVRSEAEPRRVVFAGRLDPVKRPLLLVEIAALMTDLGEARDFRFSVAGDGPEADPLREAIRKAKLGAAFDLQGHVDDIATLFASCDVCVIPSRAEGIPLVAMEALACSRPVVASNVGSIHELVDASCGVLIEAGPDEVRAFAAAISDLLDRPELRKRMGEAGRRKVEVQYDSSISRQEYLRFFEK